MKLQNTRIYVFFIALFTSGFLAGLFFAHSSLFAHNMPSTITARKKNYNIFRESGYKFISPLLDCDDVSSEPEPNIAIIKERVEKFIQNEKEKSDILIGLYFRDLNNGPWIGIN